MKRIVLLMMLVLLLFIGCAKEKEMKTIEHKNRLKDAMSPYLLQHKDNPVHWYEWGEEAFAAAVAEDKPIFLSIGYSTCHWCHVMAHESFEDEDVAKLLNDNFIAIKVDREERPDIDSVYMKVCQALTGSGGWPLTIIMTPEKKPFFAGTYIPKDEKFGKPGLKQLLPGIIDMWKNNRYEIDKTAFNIVEHLYRERPKSNSKVELDESVLDKAFLQLEENFDATNGGFGTSPKFPMAHNLSFLMNYYGKTNNKRALDMAEITLLSMRNGGIYDHVGDGFHRYSVDEAWLVPHFEKMLYDNALLASAYTDAYQLTKKHEYKDVVDKIFKYIVRDMTDEKGGFYSAEDADSEGKEGAFYLWSSKQVDDVLGARDSKIFKTLYGVSETGNFIDPAHPEKGKNVLALENKIASEFDKTGKNRMSVVPAILEKLYAKREKRIHPLKDDKILTDWNGLMIAAFAKASAVFDSSDYLYSASGAADFIIDNMITKEGGLLHSHRNGKSYIKAHLDDYAFFVYGLIELYQAGFEIKYLNYAIELTEYMIKHFQDKEEGGFFLSETDNKELFMNDKSFYDGAIPSGNSVAISNLLRLYAITGNSKFEKTAEKTINAFSETVKKSPSSFTMFLTGLGYAFGPSYEIVVAGKSSDKYLSKIMSELGKQYIPNKVIILKTTDIDDGLRAVAKYTKEYNEVNGKAAIYVCENHKCKLPVGSVSEMMELIKR